MGIFYEKYVSECTKRKKSPSAVALEIGMSKTAVNGWKTGKSNPTDATKLRLSEYFDLPISYWEDDKKKENPATVASGEVSEKDIKLVQWFRSQPEEIQKAILSLGGAPKELL